MGRIDEGIVTRRALLGGLGAGGAAVVAGTAAADVAEAAPVAAAAPLAATSAPAVSSLASPHQPGISYVYKSKFDFRPDEVVAAGAGSYGNYPTNRNPGSEEVETTLFGRLVATVGRVLARP